MATWWHYTNQNLMTVCQMSLNSVKHFLRYPANTQTKKAENTTFWTEMIVYFMSLLPRHTVQPYCNSYVYSESLVQATVKLINSISHTGD